MPRVEDFAIGLIAGESLLASCRLATNRDRSVGFYGHRLRIFKLVADRIAIRRRDEDVARVAARLTTGQAGWK